MIKSSANQICYEYYQTHMKSAPPLYQGLDKVLHGIVGGARRYFFSQNSLLKNAVWIYEQAESIKNISNESLQQQLMSFHVLYRCQSKKAETIHEKALVYLSEAAFRCLGLRPYPVQIMGSLSLMNGYLIEMATGEGKTLTAALASVISGWSGTPCHVITVNDYLAVRDAEWLLPFYSFCNISVGSVTGQMLPDERRLNYIKDVVYITSKELLADFLRDRIKLKGVHHPTQRLIKSLQIDTKHQNDDLVMRGLGTAIVDEADCILIDEAVTPLIISKPMKNDPLKQVISIAQMIIPAYQKNDHYTVEKKYKEIRFTQKGKDLLQKGNKHFPGIWQGHMRQKEIIQLSLQAKEFYHRDKHYVVLDNKVVIVDEFTGRLMPNRSWSHGLHQAVEACEGVEITDPMETLARLSFQRFFRFFPKLAGMSGTAKEASGEFWQIYRLPIMSIPTHRPCIRKQFPNKVFLKQSEKWQTIVQDIITIHQTNRPILVGTRNVDASEKLAIALKNNGLRCEIINAVRHEEEAQIVIYAGQQKQVTIATNMAGRGTDIKLGPGVNELGGLHVIATERHESGRIDRQLFGRCARQGDPGSAQAYISLEDEIIQRYISKSFLKTVRKTWTPLISNTISKLLYRSAQKKAEKLAYQQRTNVLKNDKWLTEALSFTGSELDFY